MLALLKKLLVALAVVVSFLFTCVHVLFVDTSQPVQLRDFSPYYQAAFYVRDRRGEMLYPDLKSTDVDDQTDATRKTKLYHWVNEGILCWFLYPPLLSFLFVPFSYLTIQGAVVAWQILSFFCLVVSAILVRATCASSGDTKTSLIGLLFFSFTLISVDHCLAVSQAPLVLGLLPLALGYYAWQRHRPLLAGLSWSLFFFKPSYLGLAAPIVGGVILHKLLTLRKSGEGTTPEPAMSAETNAPTAEGLKLTAALICGTLFFLGLSVLIFGVDTCSRWLHALSVKNALLYGTGYYYDGPWNFTSIESVIALMQQFRPHNAIIKPIMTALALIVLVFQSWFIQQIWKSDLPGARKKEAALFNCVSFCSLNSIYFHNYDVVLYLPLFWIMLCDSSVPSRFRKVWPTFCVMLTLLLVHYLKLPNQSGSDHFYQVSQPLLLLSLIVFAIQLLDYRIFDKPSQGDSSAVS